MAAFIDSCHNNSCFVTVLSDRNGRINRNDNTLITARGNSFGSRASSIRLRRHKAPGLSVNTSASNSCLPSLVPSYRARIVFAIDGAKFFILSIVLPLVITTSSRSISVVRNLLGFGVVVITCFGSPTRMHICNISQVSSRLRHAHSSSHHARFRLKPRSLSGSSLENAKASDPFVHFSDRLLGSQIGLFEFGATDNKVLTIVSRTSPHVGPTSAI